MHAHLKTLLWGVAGALVVEMLGRPPAAKVNLRLIGRLPTLPFVAGNPADSTPGLLENVFGFLNPTAP